jgi:hypothetical protein
MPLTASTRLTSAASPRHATLCLAGLLLPRHATLRDVPNPQLTRTRIRLGSTATHLVGSTAYTAPYRITNMSVTSLLNATAIRATSDYLRDNGYSWSDYYATCGTNITHQQLAYFRGECPPASLPVTA